MNKICTTLEQSQKLIELGIDVNTADMWWQTSNESGVYEQENPRLFVGSVPKYMMEYLIPIPAWSLSALLDLMPNFNMFKRTIECKIETTNHLIDKACDQIDAAFEMVCWLKENNQI